MKDLYILVGPPAVGKSTWLAQNLVDKNPHIISRDAAVEKVASELGWIYDDLFASPSASEQVGDIHPKFGKVVFDCNRLSYTNVVRANEKVHKIFMGEAYAANDKDCVVIDMTHMSRKARKTSLKFIKNRGQYKKTAVVFTFQGNEGLIKEVAKLRSQKNGQKNISDEVYDRMFSTWSDVTLDEGFDQILYVDNTQALSNLLTNQK